MGTHILIFAAFIVLLAAFVRTVSGFGYALLATPLLTFIFEAKSVVVMNVILGIFTSVLLSLQKRRHIDIRRVAFMGLGSIFGIPIGTYLLLILEPSIIKLAIAVLVIPFSVLLLLGHSYQFKRDNLVCGVAGLISGILGASTSLGGPPVVLLLLNQGLVTERFVGTLAAYFLFIGIASIGAFSSLGMVTTDLLIRVAVLLPALFVGTYLGSKILPRINADLFRRIVSSLVSITAIVIIVSVIMDL